MKKFVFRYQAILNKYESDEENIKNELLKAQKTLYKLSEDKNACITQKTNFEKSFAAKVSGGVSVSEYRFYENAQYHYRRELQKLDQLISEAQLQIFQLKRDVIEAMKKRKTMEKLKEREYETFLENIRIAENKVIEEIVNYQSYQKGGRS